MRRAGGAVVAGPATPVTPRLVVLRALGLGDLLTAVPALRALADAFPHHLRLLAAPVALEPLARLTGTVHQVVDTASLAPLAPGLRDADVAVNLHGRGPQSTAILLATRPRRLVAFDHPEVNWPPAATPADPRPRWRPDEHEVARWCRLLDESGIPADPGRLDLPAPELPPRWAHLTGATVVHPGASSPAKRWPPERFSAVARAEVSAGRTVVVTGSRAEVDLAREVAGGAGLPEEAVLAGCLDLVTLVAVVAAAGRVAAGDTGVAHLATATATPSVVLFGPVPPSEWGPPADRPWHRALWRRTPDHSGPGRPDADPLLAIEVDDVVTALGELPSRPPPRPRPVGAASQGSSVTCMAASSAVKPPLSQPVSEATDSAVRSGSSISDSGSTSRPTQSSSELGR